MVPEFLHEQRPTTGDSRFHRTDGYAKGLGDVGVSQFGDVAQHHGGTEVVGERRQRFFDGHAVDDGVDVAVRHRVRQFGWLSVVPVDHVQLGTAFASAQLVESGVRGDAIRPGAERRPPVEPLECPHDADHGVLRRVIGIPRRADDPGAHGVDAVDVAPQQLVEGSAIAALRGGHKRLIVGAGVK